MQYSHVLKPLLAAGVTYVAALARITSAVGIFALQAAKTTPANLDAPNAPNGILFNVKCSAMKNMYKCAWPHHACVGLAPGLKSCDLFVNVTTIFPAAAAAMSTPLW
jgi:hypothetical protein